MKTKQIKMGALYLDGVAQATFPASKLNTPNYVPGIKVSIEDSDAGRTITWNLVEFDNGNRLLIADRTLLTGISYDDLDAAGFVPSRDTLVAGREMKSSLTVSDMSVECCVAATRIYLRMNGGRH